MALGALKAGLLENVRGVCRSVSLSCDAMGVGTGGGVRGPCRGLPRLAWFREFAPEPLADCTASAKQPDANGSFSPTLLFGDFLNLESFQVVPL